MKLAGYICNVDNLGRIVIPKRLRDKLDIPKGTSLELFAEGDRIIMKKHRPSCVFCNGEKELTQFGGKFVCKECREKLSL